MQLKLDIVDLITFKSFQNICSSSRQLSLSSFISQAQRNKRKKRQNTTFLISVIDFNELDP
jgi:hypothetical protein